MQSRDCPVSSFPNESNAEFLWQVFWLMRQPEKTPFPQKQWAIFVFPSAITAEGAAADFDRVPFYRENRGHKKRFI